MAKFKVGDRARLTNNETGRVPVGAEVVVIRILPHGTRAAGGTPSDVAIEYKSIEYWCPCSWLEPLTPDLGSWEEIERLTKWKPQGVTA